MESDFQKKLKEVLRKDPRYPREAYHFMFEALRFTVLQIGEQRHVSGLELLEGIRDYALEQFGGLARMVMKGWNIQKTGDFGDIVFNLVDNGLMGKTETDCREDFRDVYDLDAAFPIDYSAPPREPNTK